MNRLLIALTIFPDRESWLLGAILILFYGLVALFWGFLSLIFSNFVGYNRLLR